MTLLADKQESYPPESVWQYRHEPIKTLGINKVTRPDQLEMEEMLVAHNVRYFNDVLGVDTGYKQFCGGVRGTPALLGVFERKTSADELLLYTTATAYRYKQDEWQYLPEVLTTANGGEASGATAIDVTSSLGFAPNDYVGIILDDGTEHKTTVSSVSAGVININNAIPVGRTVPNGASVCKAIELAGTLSIQPDGETIPSHEYYYFTNGVDTPKRYDGEIIDNVPGLPGTTFTARRIFLYNNYVCFLYTTEDGFTYPNRIRWCDTGDPTDWVNDNAGFEDLFDKADALVDGVPLGPYIILYKERTVIRMSFVGDSVRTFLFETTVHEGGLLAPNCAVPIDAPGNKHMVLGHSQLYYYDGGFGIDAIEQRTSDIILGVFGELNSATKKRAFGLFNPTLMEVWFFYPAGDNDNCNKLLRYKLSLGAWTTREWSHDMTCALPFRISDSPLISELEGAVEDQSWRYMDLRTGANVLDVILGSAEINQCYRYDYIHPFDDDLALNYEVEFGDMYMPQTDLRGDRFDIFMSGNNCTVSVSYNRGQEYTVLETVSPGFPAQLVSVWRQAVSKVFRYRLTGTGGGFSIQWIGFLYQQENPLT